MKNLNNFLQESNTLLKTLQPNILIKLLNQCQRNVDGYQVKSAKDKVLRMMLKAKFDLYRFIPAKAVCLKIPGLDLTRNTLLILLCSLYLLT